MPPKKRARTAASAASSSSPPASAAPKLTLRGGVPHHPSLVELWRGERLTDFAVSAEGVEFKTHRVALASCSGYFLNLFESGMRDAVDATHALQGISSAVLKALLAFVYEGKCEIDEGLLTEVLEASARLVVDALREACADAIGARLAPSNALNVWRLADTFTLPALEKAAVEVALHGFEELPPQLATGAEVLVLIPDDRLVAKSEEAVFRWCVRWWEAAARPEAELLAVMRHVRFAAMAEGFLRETVRVWPALGSAEAKDMLFNAMLPAVSSTKPAPRSGFGPRLIYVVGGKGDSDESKVELYDPQNASWKQLASMMGSRSFHGCVALEGKLYAVGGIGSASMLDTAEVYDPQTDGWQPLAKMSTARCEFGLAAVGGKIYAIGGASGGSTLESVEAYDPQLGAWALVASMSAERKGHASVVLDGKIYIVGGKTSGGSGALDTVEVYDPQADCWQRVASMPQGLWKHAAAAMGGKIYVTGGCITQVSLSSACEYNPQTDTWTQLASMGIARWGHASAAVRGKLYVFGGFGAAVGQGRLNTTEVYDPASDSWTPSSSLASARYCFAAAAL